MNTSLIIAFAVMVTSAGLAVAAYLNYALFHASLPYRRRTMELAESIVRDEVADDVMRENAQRLHTIASSLDECRVIAERASQVRSSGGLARPALSFDDIAEPWREKVMEAVQNLAMAIMLQDRAMPLRLRVAVALLGYSPGAMNTDDRAETRVEAVAIRQVVVERAQKRHDEDRLCLV